mmetsp:Transcript_27247/g.40346  ORF Transcript_27247/g.40346 Transcript_27247/m.40346 type:complete len:435 (-) Transcript_27247:591-1895(-)
MAKSSRSLLAREASSKSDFSSQDDAFASAMDKALADEDTLAVDLNDDVDDIFHSIQKHDHAAAASNLSSLDKRRFGLPVVKDGFDGGTVVSKASFGMRDVFQNVKSIPKNLGKIKNAALGERNVVPEVRVSDRIPTRTLSRNGIRDEGSMRDLDDDSDQLSLPSRGARMAAMGEGNTVSSRSLSSASHLSRGQSSRGGSSFGQRPSATTSQARMPSQRSVTHSLASSRPSLYKDESLRSTSSYRIPMPTMPFETKRGTLVRVAMGIIFLSLSVIFTMLGAGNGQVGMSVSSYLYNNLIVEDSGGATVEETPPSSVTSNGSHLFEILRGLERDYAPNTNGIADYHIPIVQLKGAELEVEVGLKPHVMSENHYIKYIWLRDVDANSIVLAKEFKPSDDSPPSLRAKVPRGVKLQPYVFCILHDLWVGDPFQVQNEN